VFTIEALSRYPMQSRIAFLECAATARPLNAAQAQPLNVQAIHGLLGCSEWTGVRLSTLLDEAGVEPEARWVIAEGADAAAMSRSIPLAKAMDDALRLSLSERRASAAFERLSGAAAAARFRGQT